MITPRLRPPLEFTVPLDPEELVARVDRGLAAEDCPCRGLTSAQQIDLRVREADRRFWSPQLVVVITATYEGSTLAGHFGPNANVWTMFLAAYGFVVLTAIIGVFLGVAQLMLGEPAWGLWSVPIALVLVAMIYVAAGAGQKLGSEQVDVLEGFLEGAIRGEGLGTEVPGPA